VATYTMLDVRNHDRANREAMVRQTVETAAGVLTWAGQLHLKSID